MNRTLKVVQTADGSSSIFWKELNETYHSLHGATQESRHVYIKSGLTFLAEKSQNINILEVGFGTGLNVLLTIEFAIQNPDLSIQLTTLEPFPLPEQILENLDFSASFSDEILDFFRKIHDCTPNETHQFLPNFQFQKFHQKLEDFQTENQFDLIYYDAFAPSKQSEMWELENLRKIGTLTIKDGVLVTYSSSGKFRKNLAESGFQIEKLVGPPRKKEMVRGIKIS